MQRPKIALIDDDVDLVEPLAEYLSDLGYEVHTEGTSSGCLRLVARHPIDVVILDLGLPDQSGLDFLRTLRDRCDAAVLVLTGNADPIDRIAGLEIGADDFVVKPVEPQELAARVGGLLRRRGAGGHDLIRLERATVDLVAARLMRHKQPPERLGPGEIVLLKALASHPNRVLTRDALIDMAPAETADPNDRSIDSRVARLRRKLDTAAIVTVRGHGYMFVPPFDKPV